MWGVEGGAWGLKWEAVHRTPDSDHAFDSGTREPARMYDDLPLARRIAEARSCLAALADLATDLDESSRYENLLIDFDEPVPDGPATWPINGDRREVLARLAAAADALTFVSPDPLTFELIWARAMCR